MSYRFITFNGYVPFDDYYIELLPDHTIKRVINEVYSDIRGYQNENLELNADNGATLKVLLLLADYCFRTTPFSSELQIDFGWIAILIMETIKKLFTINPYTYGYQEKVADIFSMIISEAEKTGVVNKYDLKKAVNIVDRKIGMENFDFC